MNMKFKAITVNDEHVELEERELYYVHKGYRTEIKSIDLSPLSNVTKIVCEAIKNQKDIDTAIKEVIKDGLINNAEIRAAFKSLMKECLKETLLHSWKVIFTIIGSLILSFIGGGYCGPFFK